MTETETETLLVDTREPPWTEHPWRPYIPPEMPIERTGLTTGDFAIKGLEDGAIIERKSVGDLLGCIGKGRARFERELGRGRYVGRFVVVIEGNLWDLINAPSGLHRNAILGSLAAWERRYCGFFFAGDAKEAANFALRFLVGPVHDARRVVSRVQGGPTQSGA